MAKTITPQNTPTQDQNKDKKQRKKQARQEAKLLLQLEGARKDVRKAEQKVAKAQAQLEDCRAQVYALEVQLGQRRETPAESTSGSGFDEGESFEESTEIAEMHHASQFPAEGRNDLEGVSQPLEDESVPLSSKGKAVPVSEETLEADVASANTPVTPLTTSGETTATAVEAGVTKEESTEVTSETTPEEVALATGTASTEPTAPEVSSEKSEQTNEDEKARGADAIEVSAEEEEEKGSTRRSKRRTSTRNRRANTSSNADTSTEES